MFVALYEMISKPGCENEFERAWAEVTEAIFRVRGSWGSRLHSTKQLGCYIAYAQWPSEAAFDADGDFSYSPNEKAAFEKMKSNAESIKLLHRLEVTADNLR